MVRDGGDGGAGAAGATWPGSAGTFELGPAPRDDALTYPGAVPPTSFLFTGEAIEWIGDAQEPGRAPDPDWVRDQLHHRLAALGATSLDQRHAVMAYGSNRSPAQLRAKFAGSGVNPVVPVLRARVGGLSVAYSCHITRYGSVPATVVVDPGADTEVAVTFLDDAQRDLIDETEPVHERPVLDGDRHPLRLADGSLVASYRCYRSTRAVFALDGRPVRLSEVASEGSTLPSRSQVEMHEMLLGLWARRIRPFDDARSFIAEVQARPALRAAVDRCLVGLVDDPDPVVGAVATGFGWPAPTADGSG